MTRIVYYILAFLLTVGIAYIAGYHHGGASVPPQIVQVPVEKRIEVRVEKVVYRNRVVRKYIETEKKPDGTVITKETDTDETKSKQLADTRETEKEKDKVVVQGQQPNYSLGIRDHMTYEQLLKLQPGTPDAHTIEVTGGYRLVGTFWLEGGVMYDGLSIGISYKW